VWDVTDADANAESIRWWALFGLNVSRARANGVLRPESTADPLIPADRLDLIASATTTQYITLGRHGARGEPATPSQQRVGHETPSETPEAGKKSNPPQLPPPASGILSVEAPQKSPEGVWYFTCAKCLKRQVWAPRGTAKGKDPWPGAVCWPCYKAGSR